MTEWEPATEAEAAMRDALHANDQQLYFRILARTHLLLPVSPESAAGQAPTGWGTWTTAGRTHVLAFTSVEAMRACLGEHAGASRRASYLELADSWPNHEWWLAVNPGLPVEGYLPAWYVAQLSRGDVRLPGRTMGARARLERVEALARARDNVTGPGRPGPAPTARPEAPRGVARPDATPAAPVPPRAEVSEPAPPSPRSPAAGRSVPPPAVSPPPGREPDAGAPSTWGADSASPSGWGADSASPSSVGRGDPREAANGRPTRTGRPDPGWPPPEHPDPRANRRQADTGQRSFFEPASARGHRGDGGRPGGRAVPPGRFASGSQPFPRRRPSGEPVPETPTHAFPASTGGEATVALPTPGADAVRSPGPPAEENTVPFRVPSVAGRAWPAPDAGPQAGPDTDVTQTLPRRRPTPPPSDDQPESVAEPVSAPPAPRRGFTPIVIEGTLVEARDASATSGQAAPAPYPGRPAGDGDPVEQPPARPAPDLWTPRRSAPAVTPPDLAPAADAAGVTHDLGSPNGVDDPAATRPVSGQGPPEHVSSGQANPERVAQEPESPATSLFEPTNSARVDPPTTASLFEPVRPARAEGAVSDRAATSAGSPGTPVADHPPAAQSDEPTVTMEHGRSDEPTVTMEHGRSDATPTEPIPAGPAESGSDALTEPIVAGSAGEAATEPIFAGSAGDAATEPIHTGSAGAATASTVGFVPANEVEEDLLSAADAGSTDTFLSTLLLARVLLPVAAASAPGSRPGEPGFVWRTEQTDGETFVVVYTSPERLADHTVTGVETVLVRFVQLIRRWPDEAWSFAVNPGTPVGAKLPGEQIVGLANWAAEVGLGDDAGGEPEPPATEPEPASRARTTPPAIDPARPVVMQKAVAPSQLAYYLERGYDRVSGFVHRAGELAHLSTPAELYDALGLGHPDSPFDRAAEEVYVLRWPAYRPSLYRIPYGGQNEPAMRAMEGWVIERPPFRGNGFAPGESSDVVAEFKVDSARLPHGAQLWRIGADGSERLVATLDTDALTWRQVGAS
ncbi:SseB protein N-terminal domain-containing protein [Micromonospora nigra]|uniref:SseB protein N-terminal domain-containing protein n=1 Tax=Micromonospora nigra TaxID=145857 RepID=A0A1C6S5G2_9ACTN|nr:SseB family protein [Micromonospora nigra]SCL24505.1 SseB protein N-terminal domain-containing protein [Micromonospora nigra]